MLIESFAIKSRPNIDRENGRLNNVVVMTTEFNLNRNATFTRINQEEIVALGNSQKTYCYLGHSKPGITSSDRLPFRLGYFENFNIQDTKVKADLVLSPTIESNPILAARFPAGIKEYIYTLAENESEGCGLSMVVGMLYNEDDTVSIKELSSVDLVEDPALTVALFSKAPIYEDVSPILAESFSQFNYLDDAIKQGKPTGDIVAALVEALKALNIESISEEEPKEEPVEEQPTEEPKEEPVEPVLEPVEAAQPEEATQVEEEPAIEVVEPAIEAEQPKEELSDLRQEFAEIKAMFAEMKEFLSVKFAKEEPKEEPKKVFVKFNSPLPMEEIKETEEYSVETYNELRQQGKIREAGIYYNKFKKR